MNSDEIRSAFLNFFKEKKHKIVPSSSLIPRDDPTLLLTTAGMVQFKPYFLGKERPDNPRLASCQKCFRTTDIESVGDTSHLTFFEMLGNFSIGDYFKQEAINWAWEFVTERLKLPSERLQVTIFLDDEESFQYWQKLGIPENKILRCGERDNFWGPAGNSGPCGPCSEIHYDFGEGFGCRQASCAPNCGCGRFSEIWNLVFTQYNQDEQGHRTLLPKPNIDTGMGLERTAAAMQGKFSVYGTDLFVPLMQRISELTGKEYSPDSNVDNALRVIAEHSRGITFLIGDGVVPSNESRGYVLRRLLRRAALFGRRLGLDRPFLAETARTTIQKLGHIYPEIVQRQGFIINVIELEEARFNETLNTGLELIEDFIVEPETARTGEISGEDAFRLYDTYGFPVELTGEIAAEHGLSVDLKGFNRKMGKQRERARAAHKFNSGPTRLDERAVTLENTPRIQFAGYHSVKQKANITRLLINNKLTESISEGQEASLILDATPFYGEMGGQVGDTGEIVGKSGRFSVTNTVRLPPDIIIHQGYVSKGKLSGGEEVEAEVDKERRLDIARNHTATHLLQSALLQVLGQHVQQRGSLVAPDRLRFDFSHLAAMTGDELLKVQHIVNEKVRQNLTVFDEEMSYQQAIEKGTIALFDEKYGDVVRAVRVGEPAVSAELCGGTHVSSTGEIGYFHIINESGIGAGLRRIEAVTGRGAEEFIDKRFSDLQRIAKELDTDPDNVLDKTRGIVTELDIERKQALALARELAMKEAESLLSQVEVVNEVKVLAARVQSSRIELMREMSDFIRDRIKSVIVVLGGISGDSPFFVAAVTPDLIARGYNAGDIVRKVAKVTGGGGGGKPGLAQAGGKYKDKLDEALRLVKSLI